MLARQAPKTQALSSLSTRVLPSATATTRLSATSTQRKSQQSRGLATVQDPPKRVYGGLRDQDRIFTNLYGHHGADLKSAMKYGDWYKTKEMLDKGHDWVCGDFQCFGIDQNMRMLTALNRSSRKSRLLVFVVEVALVSPQV